MIRDYVPALILLLLSNHAFVWMLPWAYGLLYGPEQGRPLRSFQERPGSRLKSAS